MTISAVTVPSIQNIDIIHEYDENLPTKYIHGRTRLLLPRSIKRTHVQDSPVPVPVGRIVHHVDLLTYIADSTLTDATKGIDAGRGLFANKSFDPDSSFQDNDLVAFYTGTELTTPVLDKILSDPDYNSKFLRNKYRRLGPRQQ